MKAAIYNPYLDTLGGGERYSLSVASVLKKQGYQVYLEWKDNSIKEKLQKRFAIDLSGIEIIDDIKRGDKYDVCFWVSDGSIPTLKARKNFLHFQVPFNNVQKNILINRMKLFRINKIIANSQFTKKIIDQEYGFKSIVIYPPVLVDKIKPVKKLNQILFVGRFSQLKQAKNHHILINAFKKFYDSGFENWKLVLAGGTDVGVGDYLTKLKDLSKNYPIEFYENLDFTEISKLYARSKIFWSAVGYGLNDAKEPEKVEHFGISVVEAMAGGAVPIVFNAGGHKEVVMENENGYLWNGVSELISKTKRIIKDRELLENLSKNAVMQSKNFSYEKFEKELLKII
jgi:glycosyltransferase involved in cell wall biosynthesis